MSDYWLREAERIGDENSMYSEWVENNKDYIIECYSDSSQLEFPEEIYEGVLDDDFEVAEDVYISSLTVEDVPDNYIRKLYHDQLEDAECYDGY